MSSPVNINDLLTVSNPSDLCEVLKAWLQAISVVRSDLDYRVDESDGDRPHDDFLHDLARYFPVLYAEAANTGNAYTATVPYGATLGTTETFETLPELRGRLIILKISGANDGPATLSINGMAAIQIDKGAETALVGGEMPANKLAAFAYNGSVFHLLNPEVPTANSSVKQSTPVEFPAKKEVASILRPEGAMLVRMVGVCIADDGDYSEGDEVDLWCFEIDAGSSAQIQLFSLTTTATAWKMRRAGTDRAIRTRGSTDDTGSIGYCVITAANWKLKAIYL